MQIELQIDHHPSGTRTLKQREAGQTIWAEVMSDSDAAVFYRAVVQHVGRLLKADHQITSLTDTSS